MFLSDISHVILKNQDKMHIREISTDKTDYFDRIVGFIFVSKKPVKNTSAKQLCRQAIPLNILCII